MSDQDIVRWIWFGMAVQWLLVLFLVAFPLLGILLQAMSERRERERWRKIFESLK